MTAADDDRARCGDCNRMAGKNCLSNDGGVWAGLQIPPEVRDRPLRCRDFAPRKGLLDRRLGRERCPALHAATR